MVQMTHTFKTSLEQPVTMLATFRIGKAWYGLNALLIQEVVRMQACTPVYSAASYVKGILNLRGKIMTVLDLSARLGMGKISDAANKPILVIPYQNEQIGLLIDAIEDVIEINPDELEPLPNNVNAALLPYLKAVYRQSGRLITLLDPAHVVIGESETAHSS